MKASSRLERVVQNLEQDVNLTRIKKLIFFACQGNWENDPGKLHSLNLRDLVEALKDQALSVEILKEILDNLVAQLNKKEEYYLIASTILSHVGQLYSEEEDTTQIVSFTAHQSDDVQGRPLEKFSDISSEWKQIVSEYDLFDARLKIMQQTNPLRAKILIFSSLYHPFTFSDRDWSLLKKQQLDELLRNLCYDCETAEILSAKLQQAGQQLEQAEEYLQAVKVIPQSLQLLYRNYPREQTSLEVITKLADFNSDNGRLNESDRSQFTGLVSSTYLAAPTSNFAHAPTINQAEEDDDKIQILSSQTADTPQQNPPENFHIIHSDPSNLTRLNSQEPAPVFSLNSLKVSNSIKQKLALEEDVKDFVDQSVAAVTRSLETTLSELENSLETRLNPVQSIEERLSVKYQALRDFVDQVQKVSAKFTDIITQLESAERHRRSPEEFSEQKFSEVNSQLENAFSKVSAKILHLAKQGNSKAIAAFIQAILSDPTIKVIVILKNQCLHIILESDPVPHQGTMVQKLADTLGFLKSEPIQDIKLHGRQSGNKSVAWSQEIPA